MPLVALLIGIGVIAFAGGLAWWTLEPINRVAGQLRFSTRFVLTDFLGLMILLQGPLAVIGRAIDSDSSESATYWLILCVVCFLVLVLWMASVSVVSRAGITRLWQRLCVIVLCVPGTLALIVAWPASIALIASWVYRPPDNPVLLAAIPAIPAALIAITFLTRVLAFWSLVGSPGEQIFLSLKHGRHATPTSG